MKNIFRADEDVIRLLDARVKRLERQNANLIMQINAQIGQAKYVRNRGGGNATQVSIPGGVSAGETSSGLIATEKDFNGYYYYSADVEYIDSTGAKKIKKGKLAINLPSGDLMEEGSDYVNPVLDSETTVFCKRELNGSVSDSGNMMMVFRDGVAYPVAVIA